MAESMGGIEGGVRGGLLAGQRGGGEREALYPLLLGGRKQSFFFELV